MRTEGCEKSPFHEWVRLEQPRLGTRVVFATDEFFAAKERLIEPAAPVFVPDRYDDHGKWMDGWESRRRRTPGHDYCIVRLGVPGLVRGVDIDTSHFTGNFPPAAALDGCVSDESVPGPDTRWVTLLRQVPLEGDSHHYHRIDCEAPLTHVRLSIYPDGGLARLRLYGEIRRDWDSIDRDTELDLLALGNGGRALAASDEHFGSMHNLNLPGRGLDMGDGWETARRRGPGNDWVILKLGHSGTVHRCEIDTAFFKGNFPDRASIEALAAPPGVDVVADRGRLDWQLLLAEAKLQADHRHVFQAELCAIGAITHVRLNIFPDGGVSRFRLWGYKA